MPSDQHLDSAARSAPSRRAFLQAALAGALAASGARLVRAAGPFEPPPQGAADAKKIALRFAANSSGTNAQGSVMRDLIAGFTRDYPNVTVGYEETPGDDHMTKIKLDASADRVPDLFSYWRLDPGFGLDQVARAGKLADLTEWTRSDPHFAGLFDASSWRTASLDGKVYGIPLTMFYVEFLANKAVFERAGVALPTDWDSLLRAVKGLKAKGEIPWAISIGNDSEGGRIYNYVVNRMVGNERALRMHAGQEPIDVSEMVKAASLLQELVAGNTPQDAISITNNNVYAKYVNTNRGGLIIDGSWVTPAIKPEIQENLVVMPFPLIPGGAQTQPNVERDLTSLIYASAKSMQDAERRPYVMELMRRLSSKAAQKAIAEGAKVPIPGLGVEVDQSKYGRVALEAQALALKSPANKWIPSVMKPTQRSKFEPLLGQFLSGKLEPPAFVAQLGQIFAA